MMAVSVILSLLVPFVAVGAEKGQTLSKDALLKAGERMYREGLLPSGEPMTAIVTNDVPVDGRSFTCVSCHLRSGLGSIEGTVVTPPTDGGNLYKPRTLFKEGFELVPAVRRYSLSLPERPAYTDDSLAVAIVDGIDPAGRHMNRVMPLYKLGADEMGILIAYLKTLSAEDEPSVTQKTITFATIVGEGVAKEDADAMLQAINFYIKQKNGLANAYRKRPRATRMALNMLGPDLLNKQIILKQWQLKGAADTWRSQLEDYYKKEPALAILGGMVAGEWAPIHRFCEDKKMPALFPFTDFPVISDSDWYTLYFSKGIYQEGEAAARYLQSLGELVKGKRIVQLVRSQAKGNALAAGFNAYWHAQGNVDPVTIPLPGTEPLTATQLADIVASEKPDVLLVWDDAAVIPAIGSLAEAAGKPAMVLLSSGYLGEALWKLPESAKPFTFLTYPYRLPQDDIRFDTFIKPLLTTGKSTTADGKRILKQGYIVDQVQSQALMMMRGDYKRDFFLDTIGMMPDMEFPLYERVSFGPGQRYASKGCYIVQLEKGDKPLLVRRSDWVIH